MSAWSVVLGDGIGDIASVVDVMSIKRARRLFTEMRPNSNVCQFRVAFSATLIQALTGASSPISCVITKDGSPYFSGYLSPNYETPVRNGRKTISITVEDPTLQKLSQTITAITTWAGLSVCNPSSPGASLVHQIVTAAGVTLAAGPPAIPSVVPYVCILPEDKATWAGILSDILFEYGYCYQFLEDGTLQIFKAINTGIISTTGLLKSGATGNLLGELIVKKTIEKYDDIRINFRTIQAKSGIVLFQDASGASGSLVCNISLAANGDAAGDDYYPKGARDGEVFCSWNSPDGFKIWIATSAALDAEVAGGISLSRVLTNYYRKASFAFHNGNASPAAITKLRITGNAYVETSQGIARVANSGKQVLDYQAKYVFDKDSAQALAAGIFQYYAHSDLIFLAKSKTSYAVGDYVQIEDLYYSGLVTACRVTARLDDESSKVIQYELEAVSDFVGCSIVVDSTASPSDPALGVAIGAQQSAAAASHPWQQDTPPIIGARPNAINGDHWIDTDDGNKEYIAIGGAWIPRALGLDALSLSLSPQVAAPYANIDGSGTLPTTQDVVPTLLVGDADVSAGTTFSVLGTPGGCTVAWDAVNRKFVVTYSQTSGVFQGYFDAQAIYAGRTSVQRFTYGKARQGSMGGAGTDGMNTGPVYLYQRKASVPAVTDISDPVTYTFATRALTGALGAWSQTVPAGTDPLWIIAAIASSNLATDTIARSEWSAPQILTGVNVSPVYLYQRAVSQPPLTDLADPLTFTFATGLLSGALGAWSQSVPAGSMPIWITRAVASSNAATDTIARSEWQTPQMLAPPGLGQWTPITSGGVAQVNANSFRKTSGASAWDGQAYSVEGYPTCSLKFRPEGTTVGFFMGLNIDPTTNASYDSIDHAFYCDASGQLHIRESGTNVLDLGAYTANTQLRITYDGATVRYNVDNELKRSVTNAGKIFYLDSSFLQVSTTLGITGISFGQMLVGTEVFAGSITAEQMDLIDLFAQAITLGGYLKSADYAEGVSGAFFGNHPTHGDGYLEVNNARVRGTEGIGSVTIEGQSVVFRDTSTGAELARIKFDPASLLLQLSRATTLVDFKGPWTYGGTFGTESTINGAQTYASVLARLGDGRVLAVYQRGSDSYLCERIMALNGTWGAETPLGAGASGASPAIAVFKDGRVILVYNGSADQLCQRIRSSDGVWGAEAIIDATHYIGTALTILPDETVLLTCSRFSDYFLVQRVRGTNGIWGAVSVVNSASSYYSKTALLGDGTVLLVYRRNSDNYIVQRIRSAGGTWGAESVVNAANSMYPYLLALPDGSVHMVYVRNSTDNFLVQRVRSAAGVWGSESVIISAGANYYPSSCLLPSGAILIAYSKQSTLYLSQRSEGSTYGAIPLKTDFAEVGAGIIEVGQNSNGIWIKFGEGRLFEWGLTGVIADGAVVNFPIPFVATPDSFMALPGGGSTITCNVATLSASQWSVRSLHSSTTNPISATKYWFAIGSWK